MKSNYSDEEFHQFMATMRQAKADERDQGRQPPKEAKVLPADPRQHFNGNHQKTVFSLVTAREMTARLTSIGHIVGTVASGFERDCYM